MNHLLPVRWRFMPSFSMSATSFIGKCLFLALPFMFVTDFGCQNKIFFCYQATKLCNEATYRTSLRQRFIAIDDFGIEGTFYDYGNPHIVFSEIVDGIEKHGTLLVANTNLTLEEIKVKYGLRTFDHLRANMHVVVIREKSLRGKYEKCF